MDMRNYKYGTLLQFKVIILLSSGAQAIQSYILFYHHTNRFQPVSAKIHLVPLSLYYFKP